MSTAADAARHAAPMAQLQRWVEPQTGHEDAKYRQPEPPLAAVLVERPAFARMGSELALGVRHAVIEHALRAGYARDPVYPRLHAVGGVLARSARVVVLRETIVTVTTHGLDALVVFVLGFG